MPTGEGTTMWPPQVDARRNLGRLCCQRSLVRRQCYYESKRFSSPPRHCRLVVALPQKVRHQRRLRLPAGRENRYVRWPRAVKFIWGTGRRSGHLKGVLHSATRRTVVANGRGTPSLRYRLQVAVSSNLRPLRSAGGGSPRSMRRLRC